MIHDLFDVIEDLIVAIHLVWAIHRWVCLIAVGNKRVWRLHRLMVLARSVRWVMRWLPTLHRKFDDHWIMQHAFSGVVIIFEHSMDSSMISTESKWSTITTRIREKNIFFVHSCQYKLTGTNGWQIDVKSVNCDQWSTCKKTLSITLGGFTIVATGTNVVVNGATLNPTQGYVNGRT